MRSLRTLCALRSGQTDLALGAGITLHALDALRTLRAAYADRALEADRALRTDIAGVTLLTLRPLRTG